MLFHSATFLLFFAVVHIAYWRMRHRAQNLFLLAASLFFYGSWNHKLLPLIVVSGSIDYFCALAIHRSVPRARKKLFLLTSIASNLTILGFFKYYNFFAESFNELLLTVGLPTSMPVLQIILPVGISFYTFQSMGYSVDVYRGKLAPCRRYTDFLLYVSFFPQLVAGPIERGSRLLPKIERPRRRLGTARVVSSLKLLTVGYFHKVALADTLAPISDAIFADPGSYDASTVLLGVYAFTLQVYCDFSGYSKIARGLAGLLGIELMVNFSQPYLSQSMGEFWRRWHISLSTWLRDYLYIPLGGNRGTALRTQANLFTTMVLSGLWHGASWNFVIWGALHGAYLAVQRTFASLGTGLGGDSAFGRLARTVLTFHLFGLALLFFRLPDMPSVGAALRSLRGGGFSFSMEMLYVLLYGIVILILDLFLDRARKRKKRHMLCIFSRRWPLEAALVTGMLIVTLLVGENNAVPFVYFQF